MSNQPQSTDLLVSQGYELHQAGQLVRAAAAYTKALKERPADASLLYLMGVLQQQQGKHDRALNFLQRATKIDRTNALLFFHVGISLSRLGRLSEAVGFYEKAIDLEPEYFEALCNLGNVFLSLNQHDAALSAYDRALRIRNNVASVHYNLGVAYQSIMRPADAITHYQRAIQLQSDYAIAYSNLSVALSETGQLEQGHVLNNRAIELDPKLAEAHFNAHSYLLASNDLPLAIDSLRTANRLSPQNEKFRIFLGVLLDYAGQAESARQFLSFKNPSKEVAADLDAWQYLKQFRPVPVLLGHALDVFKFSLEKARPDGLVMEFGVYQGTSIKQIAGLVSSTVHGFDSFEGIPEAWNAEKAGSYSTGGLLPDVPENVLLHRGWFEESIPSFLRECSEPVRLMNIDCDLYTSTKTVLDAFASRIVAGSVLIFDEFIGNHSWRQDEFKAFEEAAIKYGWEYEVICFCYITKQVAIRISRV